MGRKNPLAPQVTETKWSMFRAKPGAEDIVSKGEG